MVDLQPNPPEGTGVRGAELWSAVVADYDLEEHELALLRSMVALVDVVEELTAIVYAEGAMVDGKVNPAAVELRQATITLARTQAALRLPAGEDGDEMRRPQRRSGVRGMYSIAGGRSA